MAPASMNAPAVSIEMPPVGWSGMSGNGPRSSRRKAGPSTDAGKTLTAAAPARQAARTSVGVAAPGSIGMPRVAAQATTSDVEMRRDEERCPRVNGPPRRLDGQDRAGADRQREPACGDVIGGRGKGRQGVRLRIVQRQLEGADATRHEGLGQPGDGIGPDVAGDGHHAAVGHGGRDGGAVESVHAPMMPDRPASGQPRAVGRRGGSRARRPAAAAAAGRARWR